MREFGYTNPILINSDNMIIAGHARYQAAQELGLTDVPTILIDLPYEKAVAYVIADNRLAELAEEDTDLMRELLQEVSEIPDFDIESVGFSASDINDLMTVPDFEPIPESEVPRLDKKQFVICPCCGQSFDPAGAEKIEGGLED